MDRIPPVTAAVYDRLRAIARRQMASARRGGTLQATAVVHEALLRMGSGAGDAALDADRLIASASVAIRRVIVDHARRSRRLKRGGGPRPVPLDDSMLATAGGVGALDLVELDESLSRLAERHPRCARLVELRFFGGLTEPDAARVLGISLRTASHDWRMARAFLNREVGPGMTGA